MKKQLIVLVIFILTGCSLMGGKPPKAMIQIGNDSYEMAVGSYCWKGTCADVAGSVKQLLEGEGEKPIKVKPSQTISFLMKYKSKPNEISVIQEIDNQDSNVEIKDNQISAPTEEGTYYYIYDVRWANGNNAFYPFALEVEVD